MRLFQIIFFFLILSPSSWAQLDSKYSAKLYNNKVKGSQIKNLKWVKRLMPLSREKDGKLYIYVALKGKFTTRGWSLRSSGLKIKKTKVGSILTLVPVEGSRTDIGFTADGPGGIKKRGAFIIHFPAYQKYRTEKLTELRKRKRSILQTKSELKRKKKELLRKKRAFAKNARLKKQAEKKKQKELQTAKDSEVSDEEKEELEDIEDLRDEFDSEESEETVSENNSSKHLISAGLTVGTFSVSDTRTSDYSSFVTVLKADYIFQWTSKWQIGLGGSRTLLSLASDGGIPVGSNVVEPNDASLLGLNFRAGRMVYDSGPFSIYAHLGYHILKMSVDDQAYGAESMSGFLLLISGEFKLLSKRKINGYLKFAPVASAESGTSFSNRELAFGGSYQFTPGPSGSFWSIDGELSGITLSSEVEEFSVSTLSIGPIYHF